MKYCSYRNFIYSMCVSLKSCGWFSTQRVPLEAKTLAAAAKRAAQAAEQLAEAAAKEGDGSHQKWEVGWICLEDLWLLEMIVL